MKQKRTTVQNKNSSERNEKRNKRFFRFVSLLLTANRYTNLKLSSRYVNSNKEERICDTNKFAMEKLMFCKIKITPNKSNNEEVRRAVYGCLRLDPDLISEKGEATFFNKALPQFKTN